MKPLRDKVHDIDDKITMHKDLTIEFTRDKGKFHSKFSPLIHSDDKQNLYLQ